MSVMSGVARWLRDNDGFVVPVETRKQATNHADICISRFTIIRQNENMNADRDVCSTRPAHRSLPWAVVTASRFGPPRCLPYYLWEHPISRIYNRRSTVGSHARRSQRPRPDGIAGNRARIKGSEQRWHDLPILPRCLTYHLRGHPISRIYRRRPTVEIRTSKRPLLSPNRSPGKFLEQAKLAIWRLRENFDVVAGRLSLRMLALPQARFSGGGLGCREHFPRPTNPRVCLT